MTKEIRKEIMNYCLTLLRKSKKAYFEKLNIKEIGEGCHIGEDCQNIFENSPVICQ